MGEKKIGGFKFITYVGDHAPYHVHIRDLKDGREIGRWDIEHQCPMDNLNMSKNLTKALKQAGYLIEG